MELIKQRTPYDCALACLVMVIGQDYDHVRSKIPDTGEGMYTNEILDTLDAFDIEWDYSKEVPVSDKDTFILTVPSKNVEGRLHSIVYHHGKVYDPSTRIQYTDPEDALGKAIGCLLCYKEF